MMSLAHVTRPGRRGYGEQMDRERSTKTALRLARRLEATHLPDEGCVEWVNPRTGTRCRLQPSGLYEVSRDVDGNRVPVIVGLLGPAQARRLCSAPAKRAARRAAANVIAVVDHGDEEPGLP